MLTTALLMAVIAFAACQTGYDIPKGQLPSVLQTNNLEQDVGATYNAAVDTIFLRPNFDPRFLQDQATLAHEVTHWLQDMNGQMTRLRCSLEQEAYRVGDKYQEMFGRDIKSLLTRNERILREKATKCPTAPHPTTISTRR